MSLPTILNRSERRPADAPSYSNTGWKPKKTHWLVPIFGYLLALIVVGIAATVAVLPWNTIRSFLHLQ